MVWVACSKNDLFVSYFRLINFLKQKWFNDEFREWAMEQIYEIK